MASPRSRSGAPPVPPARPARPVGPALAPAPRRQYKSSAERQAEIARATLEILAAEGIAGWTTAALAARVGISEAALFKHFASMDEILRAVFRAQGEQLRARIAAFEPPADATPWERTRALVMTVLRAVEETKGGPFLGMTAGVLTPELRATARDSMRAARRHILRFHAGAPAPVVLPERIADLALAIVQSATLRWLLGETRRKPTELAAPMLDALGAMLAGAPDRTRRRRSAGR